MSVLRSGAAGLVLLGSVLATGCASTPKSYDYTAFKQSRPRSILVLPPTNGTPEVTASYGMLSQMTLPLAESGYYVLPVTLVDETFRQNGLTQPEDIAALPLTKLEEIFGADAALYVNITKYGTVYVLLNSESVVTAEARLIDLRSGATLWEGSASASSTSECASPHDGDTAFTPASASARSSRGDDASRWLRDAKRANESAADRQKDRDSSPP